MRREKQIEDKITKGDWALSPIIGKYKPVPLNGKQENLLIETKLLNPFEALSIGTAKGQIAIIPLDESNKFNGVLMAAAPKMLHALRMAIGGSLIEAEQILRDLDFEIL